MNQIVRRMTTKVHLNMYPPIVSTHFLNEQMKANGFSQCFRIIDASWDLPSSGRDPAKEHTENRIPGSKFFDIDGCCDKNTSLPHMLPTPELFQRYVSELSVSNDHHVIVYDNSAKFGLFSAPRVWWMFRAFGHNMVSVLNGGLPQWIKDGYPTDHGIHTEETKESSTPPFLAIYQPELVEGLAFIKENIKHGNKTQVVDARPSGRFQGIAPEPRPDIPSGHMPGSLNVPFMDCLHENRELKSKEELLTLFKKKGVDINKNIVASCGSGVSACIVALSLYACNGNEIPVYDGSWVEWATKEPHSIIKS